MGADAFYGLNVVTTLQNVFTLIVPEATLVVVACVLFIGSTVRCNRALWAISALIGLAASGLAAFEPAPTAGMTATVSPVWTDHLTQFIRLASLAGTALLVLIGWHEVREETAGEYYGCLLLIAAGTNLTAAANELITLFLALELISIPTYVLLYLARSDAGEAPDRSRPSQEAAIKYFLLSVFSSAFLLFGFSYLYGQTGTTNLPALLQAFASTGDGRLPPLALVAVVFVVAGLGFRIAAVPFHFYAPDVYQGTTPGAAAMLAYIPKLAGFAALARVIGLVGATGVGPGLAVDPLVVLLFWILAAITMTLGNVVALWQDNLQRILAYSSIAHAGYMLIGLATAPALLTREVEGVPGGVAAILFYLIAYGAMTLGAFGVIALLNSTGKTVERVDDLAGLGRSHPLPALALSVFLLGLIGLPLAAGFVGKLMLFFGAVAAGDQQTLFLILALIGVINAAVGAYYYLRIVGVMYLRGALHPLAPTRSLACSIAVALCAVATIWLGVAPDPLQRVTQTAASPVQIR